MVDIYAVERHNLIFNVNYQQHDIALPQHYRDNILYLS